MIRWLASWISAILLGLVVVAPLAALVAAAALDRGPDGAVRASIFPTALMLLDPFVGVCVRNSVLMAGAVALASLLVGIGFGRLIGDWRFPLGWLIPAALTIAAATPPAALALGWSIMVGHDDRPDPLDWRWLGWFAAAMAQGGALAALAYLSARERLDPAWRDAARLAGSSRNRVWWRLNWPLLRPVMGRAVGLIFALTLADPGAPLVLGLRRTLGFQIVATALGPEPFPRIAVLALIVLFLCSVVHLILRAWSGADRLGGDLRPRPTPAASPRRAVAAWLFAGVWSLLLAAPVLGLVGGSHRLESFPTSGRLVDRLGPHELAQWFADPVIAELIGRSAWLGAGVLAMSVVSRRAVRGLQATARGATADRFETFARLGTASPMVVGVALLAVPGLVAMIADALGGRSPMLNDWASWLGGGQAAFALMTLAVWAALTPLWLGPREGRASTVADDARIDAALLAGAGRGRARRLAAGGSWRRRGGLAALLAILGVTNIAPAILFVHWFGDSTIGPAILFFHEQPGEGLATAAILAMVVFALSAAAAVAGRGER